MHQNYNDQYINSKDQLEKAMLDHNNIVIWGRSANGKTHLCAEMTDTIINNNYEVIYPSRHNMHEICENININGNHFICHITDLKELQFGLKYQSFVFINMNNFKYPTYTTLRSGRCIQ